MGKFFGQTEHDRDMVADLAKAGLERNIDVPRRIAQSIIEHLPEFTTGDDYLCSICDTKHLLWKKPADQKTTERSHLYVTCRGHQLLVGRERR